MPLPSPLDSPRFFDDEAHSEWTLGDRSATGPRSHFADAKAFARMDPADAWVPPPEDDVSKGIGIEIVRGANGPHDDGWSVVIDGLRHPLKRTEGENAPFRFTLPSGVPLQELTATTRVRPVLVAVRLEDEALEPLSVDLAVDQVLSTTELVAPRNPGGDEPPVQTGPAQALTPYRVGDAAATAAVVPYPFWCPAQSTLGIMDLKPLLRHREVEDSINAHNLFVTSRNIENAKAYQAASAAWTILTEEVQSSKAIADTVRDVTNAVGRVAGAKLKLQSKASDVARAAKNSIGRKPTPPAPLPPKFPPPPPDADAKNSIAIGGGKVSAARELAIMFEQLARVCEERASDSVGNQQKPGLQQHLQQMRVAMDVVGDSKLKGLFDALMSADPFPAARIFLDRAASVEDNYFRQQYTVNRNKYRAPKLKEGDAPSSAPSPSQPVDCTDKSPPEVQFNPPANLDGLTAAQRAALSERLGSTAKAKLDSEIEHGQTTSWSGVVANSPPYVFTYDRLSIEARAKTTVRARIRVTVRDFDGTLTEFEFESERAAGLAAHAVYAQLPLDIAALDFYAKSFVDCMFRTHVCGKVGADDARRYVADTIRPWIQSKYYRKKPKARMLQGRDMWELFKYLPKLAADGVLGIGSGQKDGDAHYLPLDPERLEERVAELRLMIREVLPPWPPVGPSARVSDALASGGATREPLQAAPPTPDDSKVVSKWTPSQADQFNNDHRQKDDVQFLTDRQLLLLFQRGTQIADLNEESGAVMRPLYSYDPKAHATEIMTRKLPHVVSPSTMRVEFQPLPNMDAPEDLTQSDQEARKHGSIKWLDKTKLAVGAVAGTAGAAAMYYALPVGVSWVVLQATMNGSKRLFETKIRETDKDIVNAAKSSALLSGGGILLSAGTSFFTGQWWTTASLAGSAVVQLAPAWSSLMRNSFGADLPSSAVWQEALQTDLRPFMINLASTVHAFATRRATQMELKKEQYIEHRKKIRGLPVASAIDAANGALKQYYTRRAEQTRLFGDAYRETAVYSIATGTRFLFVEHYYANAAVTDAFNRLEALSGVDARPWVPIPDGSALSLLPPSEVAETLYAAEELRGLPLSQMTAFTAGSPLSLSGTTPSSIAAKAAHRELVQIVLRQRRALKGEHLMQSPGDLVVQISRSAASILRATYGISAGFTSVFGNDIMWSCVRGGIAARIAVRHLSLFYQAEEAHTRDTAEKLAKEELELDRRLAPSSQNTPREFLTTELEGPVFWDRSRRAILEQFASSLVAEAVAFAKESREESGLRTPPAHAAGIDAARRFARIRALLEARDNASREHKNQLLHAAASSVAHALLVSVSPEGGMKMLASGKLGVEEVKAAAFQDQQAIGVPEVQATKPSRAVAAWASKRVAVAESRRRPLGSGADQVASMLSGLSVGCGPQTANPAPTGRREYYCPMGSRVEALPGRVPFDIDLFDQRLVWMETLAQSCTLLSNSIVDAPTSPADMLAAKQMFIDTFVMTHISEQSAGDPNLTGATRHPLVLSADANVVRMQIANTSLCGAAGLGQPLPDTSLPDLSLSDVLQGFQEQAIDTGSVKERTECMRRVAYNAERLWFALSLAATGAEAENGVSARVATPFDAVAFAIATAMLLVDTGSPFSRTALYVEGGADGARRLLGVLEAQAKEALRRGCKVCTLSEVAICVS